MATQQIKLNDNQTSALKNIIKAGKISYGDVDGRAVRALWARNLVNVTENKKGKFVAATAKGKKLLN